MAFATSLNLRGLALVGALLLAAPVAAKTDIGGCVSSATKNQWGEASMIWYVPGTGEVCELLDCGGGRAPPKTNVPGCDNYKGTAEYQPTFLPGFGASGSSGAAEATTAATTTAQHSGSATAPNESASPKPTGADMDTTMLTGTRNPPPVTSPATTTTKAAATQSSETSTSTSAVAPSGGSADEQSSDAADSDAASATSPSAGAGAMPTAAPLGMFIGLVAGAVLF